MGVGLGFSCPPNEEENNKKRIINIRALMGFIIEGRLEQNQKMEAATGLEPVNNGFADRCLSHLAMPPFRWESCFLERETGFEPATSTLARLHSTTELFPLNL